MAFYRIRNYDKMPPFFISLVSSSDHWLFVSSTGGLTAGRINANSALFPYETDDKITEHHEFTGSKTILHIHRDGCRYLWEPFSNMYRGIYRLERNIYKSLSGSQLLFEEINHDLHCAFSIMWRTSNQYGFVKTSALKNLASTNLEAHILDGVQYLLPYGVQQETQNIFSNLLDAYKRSELDQETGIAMYSLSSTLSDMAEPSESLKATIAWQLGMRPSNILLCADQVDNFRQGISLKTEIDIKGKRGAYLVESTFFIPPTSEANWHIIMDVNQEVRNILALRQELKSEMSSQALWKMLESDIAAGDIILGTYVASADGFQHTGAPSDNAHHYANTLFNIMRGGIFANQYQISRNEFSNYVKVHNRVVYEQFLQVWEEIPERCHINDLVKLAGAPNQSVDLFRLAREYLPLSFSRRHGDPSRPWNQFSINLRNDDGSPRLDYQGNWRDIFQNWEPLAMSFPEFTEGMVYKFLNATTRDGYNPYRLTYSGFEWEIPNPDDPWGNIGYWGDHQIIYLAKLLEISEKYHPKKLATTLFEDSFVFADVPYRIKPYAAILKDWHNTIEFDWERNNALQSGTDAMGADGKLLRDANGELVHVNLFEKLLILLLSKVVNLVPDGGIWMNTQRPEWNDANNALAGKGLSVVTTAYLHRYIMVFEKLLEDKVDESFRITSPCMKLFHCVSDALQEFEGELLGGFSPHTRKQWMDRLGESGTQYREEVYTISTDTQKEGLHVSVALAFMDLLKSFLVYTLRNNQRSDGLFHSYNVLSIAQDESRIQHLDLMLEGQVSILSAGVLSPEESLSVLTTLRHSSLYRSDQHSYLLYPDRDLPGFLAKNAIPTDARSDLFERMLEMQDDRLVNQDNAGIRHFNGRFHNVRDVVKVLDLLSEEDMYADLVSREWNNILGIFEEVFHHSAFTGRSGTFFAYEGLGSIYWHMVTKLLLAAQECYWDSITIKSNPEVTAGLRQAYYDIRRGIGFNKTPEIYGSFPCDPYSHTPASAGAKQPGMTGQVKEELVARWGELGIIIQNGQIIFSQSLLDTKEFLESANSFTYFDVNQQWKTVNLTPGSLAFTFCQIPVVMRNKGLANLEIHHNSGDIGHIPGNAIPAEVSRHIFMRDGTIKMIVVGYQ